MSTDFIKKAIQAGWDEMSGSYQTETRISLDDVHYAPLCPGESELGIIGEVTGKRTLELACGAAQNSIALAKWGADVTGIDISPTQLRQARVNRQQERVEVDLVQGDAERLWMFRDGSFDLIISSFGWEFIPDLGVCFGECSRLLSDGGLLVVGTVHPLTAFEWDEEDKSLAVTDYFRPPTEIWDELSSKVGRGGLTFFHTFEEMFGLLTSTGFKVERVVEPFPFPVPEMTETEKQVIPYGGKFWERQYERLSRVPFSIVYRARKK